MRLHNTIISLVLAALLVACAGSALASEPGWGRVYTVSGTVPVRENPADTALQVRALKAGQKVRVDFQEDGWAAVFDPKEPVRSELRALGYARVAELKGRGAMELAQASSIEVRKTGPDARPEVRIDGKPDPKSEVKAKGEAKSDAKAVKTEGKPKPETKKPDVAKSEAKAAPAKGPGEIRVADRQLTVRAKRDKDSEFRKVLRQGQRVRVAALEDGWYAVFPPEEKSVDLSKAWGFSRDKYLVPESAYTGPAYEEAAPSPAVAPPPSAPASIGPAKTHKPSKAEDDDAVGYAIVERKEQGAKNAPTVTLRVRLELTQAPPVETLRKIVREIWKAERKKNENLQLEVVLTGMDPHGLAYAVARFHDDGRLKEFWWRDVVLGKPKK